MTADRIDQPGDFWDWLDYFIIHELRNNIDAQGNQIPIYRENHLPNNNILIGPVRLNQRMIKLIDNPD